MAAAHDDSGENGQENYDPAREETADNRKGNGSALVEGEKDSTLANGIHEKGKNSDKKSGLTRDDVREDAKSTACKPTTKRRDPLNLLRIGCYKKKWQMYFKEDEMVNSRRYDCVIIDPPFDIPENPSGAVTTFQDITQGECEEWAKTMKTRVESGSYVLVWVSWQTSTLWYEAMTEKGCTCSLPPTTIVKAVETMQRHTVKTHAQNCVEYVLVFKAPSVHPSGFTPDFNSPFQLLSPGRLRR